MPDEEPPYAGDTISLDFAVREVHELRARLAEAEQRNVELTDLIELTCESLEVKTRLDSRWAEVLRKAIAVARKEAS